MKIAILDNDKDFCDKIKQLIIDNSYVSGFDIDMYESPQCLSMYSISNISAGL